MRSCAGFTGWTRWLTVSLGVASNHADPEYLWNTYGMGYTMDGFRRDVYAEMHKNDEEDDDMVRYSKIEDVPDWAQDTVRELMYAGALKGDDHGCIDLSLDMVRGLVIGKRYVDARSSRFVVVDDVPGWAREETQRLIDRGALQGDGKHAINVTYDALQAMIVCQRMIDAAGDGK